VTLHLIGQGKQLICNKKGGTAKKYSQIYKHKVMINSNKLSTDVHLTKKAPSFEVTPNQLWRKFWGVYRNSKEQGEAGKSLMATPNYLSVFHSNNLTITTTQQVTL